MYDHADAVEPPMVACGVSGTSGNATLCWVAGYPGAAGFPAR